MRCRTLTGRPVQSISTPLLVSASAQQSRLKIYSIKQNLLSSSLRFSIVLSVTLEFSNCRNSSLTNSQLVKLSERKLKFESFSKTILCNIRLYQRHFFECLVEEKIKIKNVCNPGLCRVPKNQQRKIWKYVFVFRKRLNNSLASRSLRTTRSIFLRCTEKTFRCPGGSLCLGETNVRVR